MRKDEQIIAMYDGKMSAREVCNKLNESGVKVSYHYTANVIKNHKSDNVYTTSDNVHSESDNVYTSTDNVCTLLQQIVTKLSQIETRLEALEVCNTRARLSTSTKGNNNINIHKHNLSLLNTEGEGNKGEGTSPISEGTYDEGTGTDQSGLGYEDCGMVGIDDADPDHDTYQAEGSEVGCEDNGIEYSDIPPTDGITQTPSDTTDDYQADQVEYADIPPTDGLTTATANHTPANTTPTMTKGDYWASWQRFRNTVSTLTPEERDDYYRQYIAKLHSLYKGQELADMRTKLHRQYTYLCDQATKANVEFTPDQTAVITIPVMDGTMQWCRDYVMASRQMMALNAHAKAHPKEYGEYYASTIRDYMHTHGHITDDQKAAIDGLITRYLTPDAK